MDSAAPSSDQLPPGVWRGAGLGARVGDTVCSGWAQLDAELPGGGWPRHALTEVLVPQPGLLEWRLAGAALASVVAAGGEVAVVAPPCRPHLPGLLHAGLDERRLVWVQAQAPAECLWVTEQLIRSGAVGAVMAWLQQARPEQIRRLQVCAQACSALVFLYRPEAVRQEASAAPLRVHAAPGLDWELRVEVFKRRGPPHVGPLLLPSVPGGLSQVLTPRLRRPSQLLRMTEREDVVGRVASRHRSGRHSAVH